MPTYDYECPKCGDRTEVFHGMMEKPRVKCPECQGRMRKCIGTGAGIIFKGSGFYETDYRSESYNKAAKADTSSGSGDGAKTDAKTDSKADSKADTKPKAKTDAGAKSKSKTGSSAKSTSSGNGAAD